MTRIEYLLHLLAEVRPLVAKEALEEEKWELEKPHIKGLLEEIDAALSEQVEIKWRPVGGGLFSGSPGHIAQLGDMELSVEVLPKCSDLLWEVKNTFAEGGYEPTVEAAKAAAEKVARGRR